LLKAARGGDTKRTVNNGAAVEKDEKNAYQADKADLWAAFGYKMTVREYSVPKSASVAMGRG